MNIFFWSGGRLNIFMRSRNWAEKKKNPQFEISDLSKTMLALRIKCLKRKKFL